MDEIRIDERDTYYLMLFLMKDINKLVVETIHINKIHNSTFTKPYFAYTNGMDIIVKDESWYTSNADKIKLHNTLKKLVRKEKINRILTQEINI